MGPSELRVAQRGGGTGGEMLFSMVHGQLAPGTSVCAAAPQVPSTAFIMVIMVCISA